MQQTTTKQESSTKLKTPARSLRWIIVLAAAGCLTAIGFFWWRGGPTSQAKPAIDSAAAIEQARQALAAGQTETAQQIAAEILAATPDFAPAHLLLGKIAVGRNDLPAALEHFDAVTLAAGSDYEDALLLAGAVCLADDRLQAAQTRFQEVLRHQPGNLQAHGQLARLLTMTGKRVQSMPHLEAIVRAGAFDVEQLLMLGDPDSVIDFSTDLERALHRDPSDPLPRIGLARIAHKNRDYRRALMLIREAVKLAPTEAAAQATLGQLLVETEPEATIEWYASLPQEVTNEPEIWSVLGQYAESQGDLRAAIRCYAEAVTHHPNHRRSVYRLGQLLAKEGQAAQGQSTQAQAFLDRAVLLDELISVVDVLLRKADSLEHLRRATAITERLGRLWEAQAWCAILEAQDAGVGYHERRDQLRAKLTADSPVQLANPVLELDLASYPLPQWTAVARTEMARSGSTPTPGSQSPRFRDVARELGMEFSYFCGDDPSVSGWEIFQELGGGVGVLDFDRDGWPDLFFPQGCAWPPDGNNLKRTDKQHSDRLFRNVLGTAAVDVTALARLEDADYGQGLAVGDWDNDGFPDLYVANLGVNRLYRNLGDGTFLDVTSQTVPPGRLWTSSCVVADLNGDSFPDLYDVTYLAGDAPLKKRCVARGIRRACSPDQFSGEQDRLLLSQGDGRFSDATTAAGITGSNGKGLGILTADFQGEGRLSLFVANDGTPNFFYVNQASRGDKPSFAEQAVVSGLAFDGNGRSQACMGIAFDDPDHDDLWDLLVTNFHREGSTLYRQRSGDLFEDATSRAGLTAPSLPFTGFGTQFIDAELDGHPDLAVLNGHIEDFRHQDVPFKMRAQLFHNERSGRFAELAAPQIGEYFQREQLGRALATLDWDRDGRPDLVATHLDFPAALLRNETSKPGAFLKVYLAGSDSSRDGIGAVVRLRTSSGGVFQKQLVAGDGFQASNERVLLFGLGDAASIAELHVRWPSGREQTWSGLDCNRELVIRESGQMFELRRDR